MSLTVDIQCASTEPVPDDDDIRKWISATVASQRGSGDREVSVRLVDIAEMTTLNQTYRGKPGPTNVLSFPSDLPEELDLPLLGASTLAVVPVALGIALGGRVRRRLAEATFRKVVLVLLVCLGLNLVLRG